MGNVPAGYVPLGLVGFTDKGDYDPAEMYMENDLAHVENAIWKCKIDNTQGIAPAENANWTIFINSSTDLAGIAAVDTKGVLGYPGGIVVSQALIDAIAQKVMTDLVPYSKIVNNLLSTDTRTALSGPMGKLLKDDITSLYSEMSYKEYGLWSHDANFLADPSKSIKTLLSGRIVCVSGYINVIKSIPAKFKFMHLHNQVNPGQILYFQLTSKVSDAPVYLMIDSDGYMYSDNIMPIGLHFISFSYVRK